MVRKCGGKINSVGICDTCYQASNSTSGDCQQYVDYQMPVQNERITMETKPKTDEEINAMAHAYRGSGATADELFAHKVGFRQAESELLPKLQKAEERIRELDQEGQRLATNSLRVQASLESKIESLSADLKKAEERVKEPRKNLELADEQIVALRVDSEAADYYVKKINEMDTELTIANSRHEAMMAELKGVKKYEGTTGTVNQWIHAQDIQSIITKYK